MLYRKNKVSSTRAIDSSLYRLPRTVLPTHYDLELTPNLKSGKFSGTGTTKITVAEPVSEIVLNAKELDISEASVSNASGTNLEGKVTLDDKTERATITFKGTLGAGEWALALKFKGILNDKLKGFYKSTYKDENGKKHIIATTQFESTDARRAFPCWDEPSFKSTFKVSLVVDEGLTAISNTKIVSQQRLSGDCKPGTQIKKRVEFAQTMKMSTYLVAFIVGEFERSAVIQAGSTTLSVYCRPGSRALTAFALEAGKFGIEHLENYFGIKYPGDKCDLIAIPDFAAGAMENLGCITFRETALLLDPKTATLSDFNGVASTVHHELVHMWFGDLVTMLWWNGLWLNEAFATFVQNKVTDAYRPGWRVWDKFGSDRARAMKTDALKTTRPIEFQVVSPDDAQGMFDVLTYEKGASVLRMLEQYLGEGVFQKGIRAYLNTHAHGNAETTDLWDALQTASNQPVREIMNNWVFEAGFPLIGVSKSKKPGSIEVSQQPFKFLSDGVNQEQLWSVPLMLRIVREDAKVDKKLLLSQAEATVNLLANPLKGDERPGSPRISYHAKQEPRYVVVNAGGHGFYRVHYDQELLKQISANLSELSVIERYNLVSDTWACVRAGLTPATEYIDMLKLFGNEQDSNVWSAIVGSLDSLNGLLSPKKRAAFQTFVNGLLKPCLDRLGWTPAATEDANTRELRATIVKTLGTLADNAEVQKQARELFEQYLQDNSSVDADLVPAIISLAAHTGGKAEYKTLYKLYSKAKTPQDQEKYMSALAEFSDAKLLQKTLDLCLSEVRTQDAPYLVRDVLNNESGGEIAWNFIKDNWKKINKLYPESGIVAMCGGITALATPKLEKDVQKFFKSNPVKTGEKAIPQYLELLHVSVVFNKRESDNVEKYFSA